MKTAFLFPGQGAQTIGMGKDIADVYPEAAKVFETANEIVGYDLAKLCFEGPAEKLSATAISQPAIFVTSAAILEVLKRRKTEDARQRTAKEPEAPRPDVTAGLSLGEYTALYAAGVISFADALVLVQKRGNAMQAAAEATDGGMVSIIGLDEEKVAALCAEAADGQVLAPVNFNCPGQIVVSGAKAACRRAEKLAERYGAIKAIPLKVAGAFHTQMMAPAAEELKQALENCSVLDPSGVKIIGNITAEYYSDARQIKDGLVKQLVQPILWQKSMERLIADGVEQFYEIGPGRVLTGLMKRINRKIKVLNVSSAQAINNLQ